MSRVARGIHPDHAQEAIEQLRATRPGWFAVEQAPAPRTADGLVADYLSGATKTRRGGVH